MAKSVQIILNMLVVSHLMYAQSQILVIGTYTNNSTSKGIYIYDFNKVNANIKQISYVNSQNPSYQAVSKNGQFVYSVNEDSLGKVSSFSFNKKLGTLSFINEQPSNGSDPCYIALDNTGKWLFCGNYSSGTVSLYPIEKNGAIGICKQSIQHKGSSVNKERQTSPHVHCTYISPNNKFLYVVDLGIDKIRIYPFNAATGLLDEKNSFDTQLSAGSGPRHIVFAKNTQMAYIVEELSGSVVSLKVKGKQLISIQKENHLAAGEQGAGADIHLSPDEKFLYVSQRSNHTIQVYKINNENGKFSYINTYSTMGIRPRNFTINPSGKFLLVANQDTNDVQIFKRNLKTGTLIYTNRKIIVPKPVCLKWIN
jgi:6-phosphogluconolactonase